MNINNILYDAYYIENKDGKNFILPNELNGAIGVTLDSKKKMTLDDIYIDDCNEIALKNEKTRGVFHSVIKNINRQSLRNQHLKPFHELSGINLTEIMHAFIVTHQLEPNCLGVFEANQNGVVTDEIKFGDPNWTSMILFVPKDLSLRDEIIMSAKKELKPTEEEGAVAKYAYGSGFRSVIEKSHSIDLKNNRDVIAGEMADLIRNRSIRDEKNNPKNATCGQLAIRVLRSSELISSIPDGKLIKYKKLDKKELQQKLIKKMTKKNSSIRNIFVSSELFKFDTNREVLPYELFLTLFKQSVFHK